MAMNWNDIADYFGLSMETVSRTPSRLEKAAHMAITDAQPITIAQPEDLRDRAERF